MNNDLYEYWLKRALVNANKIEKRKLKKLTDSRVRLWLLEQMCEVARGGFEFDGAGCKLFYIIPDFKWYYFESGIFEMHAFM